MYATCLFCHSSLGRNRVVDAFPVGRRLAFDPAKGRLWAICARCGGWNLSPIEERWEAIEQCERFFASTALRFSTEHVGLANGPSGFKLIRVGAPSRREFAAWRYGRRVRRRFRRASATLVGGITGVGALSGVGAVSGLWSPLAPVVAAVGLLFISMRLSRRAVEETIYARLPRQDQIDNPAVVRVRHLSSLRLLIDDRGASWSLCVPCDDGEVHLDEHAAAHLLGRIAPAWNAHVGRKALVDAAVDELERAGGPGDFLLEAARRALERQPETASASRVRAGLALGLYDVERLALEMAVHEEVERRAITGDLSLLHRAWQEAEEIAAIADNLLLPPGIARVVSNH
jgi:hypothetical protein